MNLELVGSVFAVLRKLHKMATEGKANLDKIRHELDANDEILKHLERELNNPAMHRALMTHTELRERCGKQLKSTKLFQLRQRKKFQPLYDRIQALVGHVMKVTKASILATKTVRNH